MKKIIVGICILFFMATVGLAQESKQPLQLTIKSDKQAYEVGEKIELNVMLQNLSDKELIVFWNKQEVIPVVPQVDHLGEGIAVVTNIMIENADVENLYIKPKSNVTKRIIVRIFSFVGNVKLTYRFHNLSGLRPVNFKTAPNQQIWMNLLATSNTITIEVVEKRKTTSGPIDRLVERLSETHGLWVNGESPVIMLPSKASIEEVVSEVFQMTGFEQGHVTSYKIIQIREVQIPVGMPLERYTAVLVQTNFGKKIVLLGQKWWSRVYDVE